MKNRVQAHVLLGRAKQLHRAAEVAVAEVVQRDGRLEHGLIKPAVLVGAFIPQILKDFVGLEELLSIEEHDSREVERLVFRLGVIHNNPATRGLCYDTHSGTVISNMISSAAWAQTFRMIRIGLEAGLPVVRVFTQQSQRGPHAVRSMMSRVAEQLSTGSSLAEAIEPEKSLLPPLVAPLLAAGEEAGRLGESLRELEEFFDQQHALKRQFRANIAWPVIQLVAAIGVIALFLLIIGMLGLKMEPLGSFIGNGVTGATRWLTLVAGCFFLGWVAYRVVAHQARFLPAVERLILMIPGIGSAVQCLLLSRFCVAMKMTLGSGLPVKRAVRLSCEATGSQLYAQAFDRAKPALGKGATVTEALTECAVFPAALLDAVEVGEESGSLPEVMDKQAEIWHEDAAMKLRIVTQLAAFAVYGLVALMIILLIAKIYSTSIAPAYSF